MGVGYTQAFIAVAPDCPVGAGTEPSGRSASGTAGLQFAMLRSAPHRYTSEDLIFAGSTAGRAMAEAPDDERRAAQEAFFSRPQACLRASPLPKRWGWGLHFDQQGRVALVGCETEEYRRLLADPSLRQLAAMRSHRT